VASTYRYPFTPYPDGWYLLCESASVALEQVVPLRYFGRDLVLFRTDGGHAVVADAYCPHMRAHLGYGGMVEGESNPLSVPPLALRHRRPVHRRAVREGSTATEGAPLDLAGARAQRSDHDVVHTPAARVRAVAESSPWNRPHGSRFRRPFG
jgi:hypothetical protein